MPEAVIRKVAIYSLLLNVGLVGAKLFLSSRAGSLALQADAVHSLVDVLASLALIAGLEISGRKTRSFPYGLYKVENVAAVIISLLLFLTAYEIALQAWNGRTVEVPAYGGWILWAVAALVPIPFLFGSYQERVGRQANSPSLTADGTQHKADVLTSSLVFVALLAEGSGLPLDRIAAAIIALVIVKEGWKILKSGMQVLLDASVDKTTLKEIQSLITEEPAVTELKEVTARNSGRYLFIEASVILRITDLRRAHQISEHIEDKIRKALPNVDRVLIHYEPKTKTELRYAVPLVSTGGEISNHFGEAPYFALLDIDCKLKTLQRQEVVANPHKDLPKGKGLKVAAFLLSHKPDVIMSREGLAGKGPGYAFAESGVETAKTEAQSIDQLIEEILSESKSALA